MRVSKRRLVNVSSLIVGLVLVGGALSLRQSLLPSKKDASKVYALADLAANDGNNGHDCLVAIDKNVYEVKGFTLWAMGAHTPSNGQVKCGMDASPFIDKAPHGRSKLQLLPIVGKLN
jgi:predicted heme/steroid binding protein